PHPHHRRGRAAPRGLRRRRPGRVARSGAAGAALLDGRADLRGRRARHRRSRRGPAGRPPARQGGQGPDRAGGAPRAGRRRRLPGARSARSRPPWPWGPGAVRQRSGCAPVTAECLARPARRGGRRGPHRRGLPAHPAALFRDPPARGRRRRARRTGAPRPRLGDDDADLHARDRRHPPRGVRDLPSPGGVTQEQGSIEAWLTSLEFDGLRTAGRVAGRRRVLLLCAESLDRTAATDRSAGMQNPRPTAPRPEPLDDEETVQRADSVGRHRLKVPEPAPLTEHGPARVIAVANQKGGVGKTTSTINLGAALAEYGRRVLLVDFDPQGALSVGLGVQAHELETTIYNLLMERGVEIDDVIRPTTVEGMDLLPSNIDLSAAEVQLVTEVGREQALGRALKPVLDRYDVILIDCQPSLGLLTINALACAERILIPLA